MTLSLHSAYIFQILQPGFISSDNKPSHLYCSRLSKNWLVNYITLFPISLLKMKKVDKQKIVTTNNWTSIINFPIINRIEMVPLDKIKVGHWWLMTTKPLEVRFWNDSSLWKPMAYFILPWWPLASSQLRKFKNV